MKFASVFLSHSSGDKELVKKVADKLRRRGLISWLDKNELCAGEDLTQSLKKAIQKQTAVALFLSEKSANSDWVKDELMAALEIDDSMGQPDRIIPVYLGNELEIIRKHDVLRTRWLHTDGNRVNRIGIKPDMSMSATQQSVDIAEKIAQSIFDILKTKEKNELYIVLDQRGNGKSTGIPDLPKNVLQTDAVGLIFRPYDADERS
ncbi:MAG: toll/interleukin-1 receptor domain-containing protein, partial [Desulfobacula sp.]|nr:toll/interleukin-1 receptor domain-containing protein [Desulfobacula sp.]